MFINPRHACAARVTVLGSCVCVCVCLSVYINSRPTGYEPAYEQYHWLKRTKGSENNVADFAETSTFELERETGTARDDIAWPNPPISGVRMHVRSVAGLEHAYIIAPVSFLCEFFPMEASRYKLRKDCHQCGTTVHIKRAVWMQVCLPSAEGFAL